MGAASKPKGARSGRTRQALVMAAAVGAIAVFGVGSVSLLGRTTSSKFSSVGYAIGDESVSGSPRSPASNPAAPASTNPAAPSASTQAAASASTPGAADVTASLPPLDAAPTGAAAAAGHAFVSTATLTVRVPDVDQVNAKKEMAINLVEGKGGGLFGEETSFSGAAQATVTLKVPPSAFRSVLSDLAKLGSLDAEQVKTDDVTQQVVDLDARISAAQSGLDRMRGLLAKTSDLRDVANLETDVNRREIELEQLKGQQQSLGQRVDLSTVILTLRAEAAATTAVAGPTPVVPLPPTPPAALPGFGDGLQGGWKVFTNVGTVVLAGLGACLPFVPVALVAFGVWRLARRRDRGSRPVARPPRLDPHESI